MRRLIAALALVSLAACASDTSTNPNNDAVEGAYSLHTVNGQPLPYTIQGNGVTIVLTSDVLTVREDGSWTETVAYKQSVNGGSQTNEADADAGTWTRIANTITFESATVGSFEGTYSKGSVTFDDPGLLEVFKR
jgi:hypothetical protein